MFENDMERTWNMKWKLEFLDGIYRVWGLPLVSRGHQGLEAQP